MDELQLAGEFEELELQARITLQIAGDLGSVMNTLCTAAVLCVTAPCERAAKCSPAPGHTNLKLCRGLVLVF